MATICLHSRPHRGRAQGIGTHTDTVQNVQLRLDNRTLNTGASTWWLVLIYMVVDLLSFEVNVEAPCKSLKHLVNIVYMAFANKHHVKQSTWGGTLSPMCLGFTWCLCLGSF